MIRSVAVIVICVCASFSSLAQDVAKKAVRPDIPGTFLVDFGTNGSDGGPSNFDPGIVGSRTINLYYQYPMRFGRSKFSFVPGIGLGMDRFKLSNNFTLSSTPTADGNYELINADTITLFPGVKKSLIIANYFDIPIEFRFDTHPEDISRSFNIAVGARAGVLFDGLTKIKYKEDGETKIIKDKQNHGLNNIRYGLYSRIGVAGFNFFFFYNSSTLFKTDKGPEKTGMNSFTVGISINGF